MFKKIFLSSLLLLLNPFFIPYGECVISTTTDKIIYAGDGYSTVFSFPYNIYLATDLAVYETIVATSNTTQLTLNTNYTVTLTAVSGVTGAYTATINLAGGSSPAGALAVGTQLTILRSLPLTQLINISDYSATPAATWNQALDRATILTQQLQEQLNRAVLGPINSNNNFTITFPSYIANTLIGWSPISGILQNSDITDISGTSVNISVPLTVSSGITAPITGNVTGNVSGNAGTVTNGAYTGTNLVSGTFTNASLTGGVLTITHNRALAAPYAIIVKIFNNSGSEIEPDSIVGSSNSVAVTLTSWGSLTGTWGYQYASK